MSCINPEYYKGKIECIHAIKAAIGDDAAFRGFLKGQVMKYVWRYERKNGVEDLEKAMWYLEWLIIEYKKVEAEQ